jgi:outer membrane receptor protein involved in Fe transport
MLLPLPPGLPAATAICCVVASCAPAEGAAAESVRSFDLPPGDAAVTLKQFSAAAGTPIIYLVDRVRGVATHAVRGEFAPREALDRMLAGSALEAAQDATTGALVVSRKRTVDTPPRKGEVGLVSDPQPNPKAKPMKSPRSIVAALAGWLAATTAVDAQTVAAPLKEEDVILSPFEITVEVDRGYAATSTLAGARLATSLKETPAAIGVVTREFIDDILGVNLNDIGNWATNTTTLDNNSVTSNVRDRDLPQVVSRGIRNNFAQSRNYFPSQVTIDSFNTERLDIPRGPNALLYGDGPLGGIITSTTKRALFGKKITATQALFDDYGSRRATLDVNRPIGKTIAIRFNGVMQRNNGWRDNEQQNRDSVHGAISYRPWKNGQIRGEIEWGRSERDGETTFYTEQISTWDQVTGTGGSSVGIGSANTGTTRISTNTDYLLWNQNIPGAGLLNWRNTAQTTGSGRSLLPGDYALGVYRPGTPRFPILPDRASTLTPPTPLSTLNYKIFSAYFEQTLGKLAVEFAFNYEEPKRYWYRDRPNAYYLDLNAQLPNGQANPYYLKPFDDAAEQRQYTIGWGWSYRATAAYPFDFGFMTQKVVLMAGYSNSEGQDYFFRKVRINNPTLRNFNQSANTLFTRRYWNESATPYSAPQSSNGIELAEVNNTIQGSKSSPAYLQIASAGSYFKRRVSTIVGYRADRFNNDSANSFSTSNDWERNGINPVTDYLPPQLSDPIDASGNRVRQLRSTLGRPSKVWNSQRTDVIDPTRPYDPVKNPRYNEVYPQKDIVHTFSAGTVFFPIKQIGGYFNVSSGFQAPGLAQKLNFSPVDPFTNRGMDAGLRFELFDGRISGSVGTYRSLQRGNSVQVTGNNFGNIWEQARQGYENAANGTADAVLASQYRAKAQAAQTAKDFILNGVSHYDYQEQRATGYELDVTANLTRSWRALFNLGLPESKTYERLPESKAYFAANVSQWQEYLADTAVLAVNNRNSINTNLNAMKTLLDAAVDGFRTEGVPEYTANVFSTYRVGEGRLKNLRFGGGVQFRGSAAIPVARQVYGVNPANGLTQFYAPNPVDNLSAESYRLVTALVGYELKLRGIAWNLQLNVSNLFDEHKLLFSTYNTYTYSDNGVTRGTQVGQNFYYIPPRKFTLSLSARF